MSQSPHSYTVSDVEMVRSHARISGGGLTSWAENYNRLLDAICDAAKQNAAAQVPGSGVSTGDGQVSPIEQVRLTPPRGPFATPVAAALYEALSGLTDRMARDLEPEQWPEELGAAYEALAAHDASPTPEHCEGKVERLLIAAIDLSTALAEAEERHDLNLPPSVDSAWAWLTACIQEMEPSSDATVDSARTEAVSESGTWHAIRQYLDAEYLTSKPAHEILDGLEKVMEEVK